MNVISKEYTSEQKRIEAKPLEGCSVDLKTKQQVRVKGPLKLTKDITQELVMREEIYKDLMKPYLNYKPEDKGDA